MTNQPLRMICYFLRSVKYVPVGYTIRFIMLEYFVLFQKDAGDELQNLKTPDLFFLQTH